MSESLPVVLPPRKSTVEGSRPAARARAAEPLAVASGPTWRAIQRVSG